MPPLQMCILDGRLYDEMGVGADGDGLDAAALLSNNSGRPLLVSAKGAANAAAGHVVVPLEVGRRQGFLYNLCFVKRWGRLWL